MADVLNAFSLNCLVGGIRFAHCRRLLDDGAVAKINGMRKGRLCGEDAFRTLKPLNPSPQGGFWEHCKEDFSAYVTNLTCAEADAFQVVQLCRQRADAEWSGATWTGAHTTCREAVRPEGSIKTSLTSSRINGASPASVRKRQR